MKSRALLGAFLGALALVAVLALPRTASAQVALSSPTYPLHEGTTRIPLATDPRAANVGINRADCVADLAWTWAINPNGITFDHLDLYASVNSTSCADLVARTTTKTCFKIASFQEKDVKAGQQFKTKLRAIVQAVRQTDVVDPSNVALDACDVSSSMTPAGFFIHFLPMDGAGTPVGGTGVADYAFQTAYDIGGPAGPSDMKLAAGNELLVATWTTSGTLESDFHNYRAYYYTDDAAVPTTTKDIDGGTDGDADADEADVADTATSDTDAGTSDAADASDSATDSGTVLTTGVCPAGVPFVVGELPSAKVLALPSVDSGTVSGKLTVTGLQNGKHYAVAVYATDNYVNSGRLASYDCLTPKKTIDFYTAYQDAGGTAGGGICSFAGPYANPIGALFLAVTALGLLARRGTRR